MLIACGAFVLLASGLYSLVQLLLPPFLVGGPMVQNVSSTAATIVWYMSKPARGAIDVTDDAGKPVFSSPSANEDTRLRVRLTGLSPGRSYRYTVRAAGAPGGAGVLLAAGALATPPAGEAEFSFAVLGDSGLGGARQFELAGRIVQHRPAFVLHTGDVVYPRGARSDYVERFFAPYRELVAGTCFWPSLGNHDAGKPSFGGDYLGVFDLPENGPPGVMPERNYWFDWAGARFVCVDSDLDEPTLLNRVAPWVRDVFAERPSRWRFVFFHHPPYSCGPHGGDERVQRALVPAFEAAGVNMVFCGHDHLYERTAPLQGGKPADEQRGIVYVTTGAGGAELYQADPPGKRPGYFAAVYDQKHSFTLVTVAGDSLRLRQIAVDGAVVDDWSLARRAAEGDPPPMPGNATPQDSPAESGRERP